MAATPNTQWLICTISPGIFNNEVVVSSSTAFGSPFSLFVPTTYVQHTIGSQGLLAVNVLESSDKYVMVSLPTQPLESSQTVTVLPTQLKAAA